MPHPVSAYPLYRQTLIQLDPVLQDLQTAIASNIRRINDSRSTFEASSIQDNTDRQRYWTKNSLKNHIQSTHPNISLPNETINLLWRSFHFYAHHPFPHYLTENSKIDVNGFQRAVAFLVHDATDLLGTLEDGDYYWRFDEAFFRKASFSRILRSIGHLEENGQDDAAVDDVMDVLAMTQPQAMKLMPSPDQLRPVAWRMLEDGRVPMGCRVGRRDLVCLVGLVLKMRLGREKWGYGDHLGVIGDGGLGEEGLAEVLVKGVVGDKDGLEIEDLQRVKDLLPNLGLRFHQLWKVIFQPRTDNRVQEMAGDTLAPRILSAISLFIPLSLRPAHCRSASQDTRIPLQKSEQMVDMTVSTLVRALQQNPRPKLIIATDDDNSGSPDTVVGAFIPGLLYSEGEYPQTGTSHFLFQLQPEFRLLRWPHTPLVNLINGEGDGDSSSIEAMEAGVYGMSPYRIGNPLGSAGIRVDPATKSITLSRIADAGDTNNAGYKDVCLGDNAQWEVVIQPGKMEVYNGLFQCPETR
ncbi:hypothetical protein BO94DRAFT_572979 [Aspergillus sclerotioniger CBS 115572]|uniref:TLDc domain-containing protein n=1 Tax=Aspergillus sclerotioniger CBS 115572 TaxID=1450535 RepID=A0A317X7L3_9EURO|nr:hypothetical protein BO94DRAFT_572979 [Aspergillus sclerotioniger CBS 115572]PWY93547.1 hypothetical protein BO94DRAFT_572979 [Aspergillus sclerotioniger CBS 115572]